MFLSTIEDIRSEITGNINVLYARSWCYSGGNYLGFTLVTGNAHFISSFETRYIDFLNVFIFDWKIIALK